MQNVEDSQAVTESENKPLIADETQAPSRRCRFYLDPGVFLLFFGWNLSGTVLVNEILVQTCYVTFNFSHEDCILLGRKNESAEIKYIDDEIQPFVAKLLMVKMMIESVLPAILILLLGPLSDHFGRKPILNSTCIGLSLYFAALCLINFLSDFYTISPWYYTLAIIIFSLSGGFPCILTAILSHTTDSSSAAKRSERITIIELMIFVGVLLGTFTSSYLVTYLATFHIFLISFICVSISAIYIIFFIEETVVIAVENQSRSFRDKLRAINLGDLFQTCIKRREDYKRGRLILLMSILMLAIFVLQGSSNVFYLFERKKFNWTVRDANLFDSASMVISIFGTLGGLYFFKKLIGSPDVVIIIFSLLFKIAGTSVVVLATKGWHMYVSSAISFIGSLYGSMCRSSISQMVDNNEIGKVFAITTALEAVSTLGAAPIYTFIYTNTYETFPSAFALVTIVALILNVILALVVALLQSRNTPVSQVTTYQSVSR